MIKDYKPKDGTAELIAGDLLRLTNNSASDENCKLLCYILEGGLKK